MTWSRSSFWSLLALGTLILAPTFACQESPVEPRPNDRALAGAWCPTWAWWNCDVEPAAENNEEEIFGGVFMNDSPLTPSQAEGFEVVLNEVPGTGACIHHFDDGPGTCRVSQQMPVRTEGSVVGSANSNKHFGWYNNLDTGDNPCNPSRPDHTERHDTNLDGVADPGNEKHCVTPGSYKIRLVENGVTRFTREIDHVRNVGGVTADGGRTIENPNGDSATDVVVQFELASTVPVNLGVLKLDDGSDGVNSFVNGNLTVEENVPVHFLSTASTTWGNGVDSQLLYRVRPDAVQSPGIFTRLANPDRLVRTLSYAEPGDYVAEARIISPSDVSTIGQAPPTHTVSVTAGSQQPSVASVDVTPSSTTIDVDSTVALTATPKDASNNPVSTTVTWSTSNASVATVVANGNNATVTGQSAGEATIFATVDNVTGEAAITVQPGGVDDATELGNTFPVSMFAGGIASVTLTMKNSGTTVWTSGYKLSLVRESAIWMPSIRFLSADIGLGADHVFAFDLRHIEPEVTGSIDAVYQMMNGAGVLFGDENGETISVSGSKTQAATTEPAETNSLDSSTTSGWTANASDAGTSKIPIPASALANGKIALLEYTYSHAVERDLDVVLLFEYDPDVLVPLPPRAGSGAAALGLTKGLTGTGEYWVRLTGTVPSGEGRIVTFPFRLKSGATPPEKLGTLRMYYPNR